MIMSSDPDWGLQPPRHLIEKCNKKLVQCIKENVLVQVIGNPTRGEAQLNLLFSRKTVAELIREVALEIEVRQGRQEEDGMAKSRSLSQTKMQKKVESSGERDIHLGETIGMWSESTWTGTGSENSRHSWN